MTYFLRRRRPKREIAADGSMPLMEHIRELRDRLFKACLGVLGGMIVGLLVANRVLLYLNKPYCDRFGHAACQFNAVSPLDPFLLKLKVALYVGLIISSPIWLYQLWSFITPGLHRNEKRWAYGFISVAVPLFVLGAWLAHLVVARGLEFLLPAATGPYRINVDIGGYFNFITGMLLIFGVGFEFPLVVLMLNLAGVASAKRLLGWWRPAVFLTFLFCAIATPTPDPIAMTALGSAMCLLYFGAVGAAFLNERRRAKLRSREYDGLSDDEASQLDHHPEPVAEPEPVAPPEPIEPARIERRRALTDDSDFT